MYTRTHLLRKSSSTSAAPSLQKQASRSLAHRAFSPQIETQALAVSSQEPPDLQAQLAFDKAFGFNLSNVSILPPQDRSLPCVQTKLTLGKAGDKYEQQADQVAAAVVDRINNGARQFSVLPPQSRQPDWNILQRQPRSQQQQADPTLTGVEASIQAQQAQQADQVTTAVVDRINNGAGQFSVLPPQSRQPDWNILQRQPRSQQQQADPTLTGVEASIQAQRSRGQTLPQDSRDSMESAFGADFSRVKVHTDSTSDQLNRSLSSRAFTTGQDIFFKQGEYNPSSRQGQTLLAHELTHVIQQNGGALQAKSDATSRPSAPTLQNNVLQRELLDQPLPAPFAPAQPTARTDAVRTATQGLGANRVKHHDSWAAKRAIRAAVAAYEQADQSLNVPNTRVALDNLHAVLMNQPAQVLPALSRVKLQLLREVNQIRGDWDFANNAQITMNGVGWANNADNVSNLAKELTSRRVGYGNSPHQTAVTNVLAQACDRANAAFQQLIVNRGREEAIYGDPTTGVISAADQNYLDDFDRLKTFLNDKNAVLAKLRKLSGRMERDYTTKGLARSGANNLTALKAELSRVEQFAGFSAKAKVPLGILPGDVFLGLMTGGDVLDDYGAGVVHGELTHRLQWYAIIREMTNNLSSARVAPWNYTPRQLYVAMSGGKFGDDRTGNSMWGNVLDNGTAQSDSTYGAPGTLNRDLLQADPNFNDNGVLLPGRGGYTAPKLTKLTNLGEALTYLRTTRIDEALQDLVDLPMNSADTIPGGAATAIWSGVPSEATATRIGNQMVTNYTHNVGSQGTVGTTAFTPQGAPQKTWKVLQER